MFDEIIGRVRGLQEGNYPENREDEQFHLNSEGDQVMNLALPPSSELSRQGESYVAIGTGVNAINALPTTVAHLFLHNQEPHGQKSYAISHIGVLNAGALAAIVQLTLYAQVGITAVAVAASTIAPKSLNGRYNYKGQARVRSSVTVTADAWHNIGRSMVSDNAAANIMLAQWIDVQGRYLIPPGGSFGLTAVCNSGTPSCQCMVIWSEIMGMVG